MLCRFLLAVVFSLLLRATDFFLAFGGNLREKPFARLLGSQHSFLVLKVATGRFGQGGTKSDLFRMQGAVREPGLPGLDNGRAPEMLCDVIGGR